MALRVLVIAARGFESGDDLGSLLARAFAGEGHEVQTCSHRDVLRANPLPGLAPMRRLYLRRAHRALLDAARAFRPALVVAIKGETIPPDVLAEVKSTSGACMVNFFPDNPYYYPSVLCTVAHYDRFLVKDSFVLQQMHLMGARHAAFLAHCADPDGMGAGTRPSDEERSRHGCQVVLVGSLYRHRYELLRSLSHYRVKVWGSSIAPELRRDDPYVRQWWQGRPLTGPEKGAALRCADVAFNSHHPLNDIHGVNQRTFDACGAGAFQVVEAQHDLARSFDAGSELVTYGSPGELREVVAHFLERPAEREAIAERGLARVRREHTYRHRVREIMDLARLA